jgi:hypothetical protein
MALAACLAFAGCAAPAEPQLPAPGGSTESTAAPIEQEMVGTRYSSSVSPPGPDDPAGVKYSYDIAPGETFTGYYEIDNLRRDAHSYQLMAFLDYQQVPISVDGTKALSHTLRVDAAANRWWPIELGPFPKGTHTLTTILLWDPDDHSLDRTFRLSTEEGLTSTNQSNVMVGTSRSFVKPQVLKPTRSYKLAETLQYDGVRINRSKTKLAGWLGAEAKPGETIEYYIHVGNTKEKAVSYSLIALLGGEQISIGQQKGATIIRVPAGMCYTFKTSVTAPVTPGIHELQVVRGVDPFTDITDEMGILMESSIRVPITVK